MPSLQSTLDPQQNCPEIRYINTIYYNDNGHLLITKRRVPTDNLALLKFAKNNITVNTSRLRELQNEVRRSRNRSLLFAVFNAVIAASGIFLTSDWIAEKDRMATDSAMKDPTVIATARQASWEKARQEIGYNARKNILKIERNTTPPWPDPKSEIQKQDERIYPSALNEAAKDSHCLDDFKDWHNISLLAFIAGSGLSLFGVASSAFRLRKLGRLQSEHDTSKKQIDFAINAANTRKQAKAADQPVP